MVSARTAPLTHDYSKALHWPELEVGADTQYLECGTRSRLDFLLHNCQLHSLVSIQVFLGLSFLICKVTLPIGFLERCK